MARHRSNQDSKRLQIILGVGVIGATAIVATLADPTAFRSGRDFTAWVGLVPRQDSTGGKPRLGPISKQGDRYHEHGKPRAARFPVGQADLVAKAAKAMNLTVAKAEGGALARLAKKLPPGRLHATGGGFVPPVGHSLYDIIVEDLKLAGQPVPEPVDISVPAAPGLPASWDGIEVGHMVISAEAHHWYAAVVVPVTATC